MIMTDRPTNERTDRRAHREIPFPISIVEPQRTVVCLVGYLVAVSVRIALVPHPVHVDVLLPGVGDGDTVVRKAYIAEED